MHMNLYMTPPPPYPPATTSNTSQELFTSCVARTICEAPDPGGVMLLFLLLQGELPWARRLEAAWRREQEVEGRSSGAMILVNAHQETDCHSLH